MMELFYPAMGALALGVLWLNTLLIAAAALKQRAALAARRSELSAARREGALKIGTVRSGRGPNGELVTRTIHQVGRAMTVGGPPRILFTQGKVEVAVHGGELSVDGSPVVLDEASPGAPGLEVWLAPGTETVRSSSDFADAHRQASTSRGLSTTARQTIRPADPIFFLPGRLLSTVEPTGALGRRMAGLALFAVISVALAVGITALVFVPPVFGTVSTVGGALGLLFFVLVQPAGVKVRNWARLPHEQPHSELWQG